MADNCIYNPARNKFGYSQETWNRIKGALRDKVPTSGKFTNVVRNLGVDDTRMVNVKGEDGKRFFGKNITDVSDLDMSKPIANNVVVRVPTKYGEKFFVSNKNGVTSEPSRWSTDLLNGRLVPNKDWDAINPNVTGMKRYVKDKSDGLWREAGPNETGSFLNIQNPSKQRYGKQEVADRGIDAFEFNGKYELIDESTQAINPKMITEKPLRDAMYEDLVTEPPNTNDLAEIIQKYNVPRGVASTVAGGIVGNYADQDGEFGGTFWGGAIGLMLGMPKVRSKVKGVYSKATSKNSDDPYMNYAADVSQKEQQHMLREDAVRQGYKGDTTDMEAIEKFMSIHNRIQSKKQDGSFSLKTLFDNEYFRSGEGLFKNMSTTAKNLFTILRGFESKPAEMYSQFGNLQTRAFGRENTKQIFRQTQIDFIQNATGTLKMSDDDALQSFGASVKRLITYGGRIDDDGKFVFNSSPPANKLYNDPDVRAIDEALLRDPQAQKVYQVTKQFFDQNGKKAVDVINRALDNEMQGLAPNVRSMFEDVMESGLTFKQFKKANPDRAKELDGYLSGKHVDNKMAGERKATTDRIKALIEDRKRFNDLQDNYIPQKFSPVKEAREKKAWLTRNGGEFESRGYDSEQIEGLWQQHKADQILQQNKEKFTAFEINEDGMDVNKAYFANNKQAIAYVKKTVDEISDETKRTTLQTDVEENIRDYITKNANGKYEVTTPERWRDDDWFPDGLYETKNADIVDRANRAFVSTNLSKNADHFDRPRNMDIPTQYLETDLEKLVKFYTDDMAMRLHAIDNGMYDANAVQKNWIGPIRQEVKNNFSDEQVLNTRLNEVESWISLMQGQRAERKVGLTEADRRRMRTKAINDAKNDSFLNSISKMATASFNYGTTLYSMFTPLVFGPFMSSFKHIGREYKHGFLHPKQYAEQLKNFTDEIEKMGIIQKKFESFAPEHKRQYREDLLGDTSSWRRRLADFSDGATNFTANLSIARMLKIDPENLGIARLAIGNMLDISGAEAGMVTMSVFRHIEDLVDAGKRLNNGEATVKVGGSRYSKESLNQSFEQLGIVNPDKFIREADQFDSFTKYMKGQGSIDDFSQEFYGQMSAVTNTIIDQYHGRTKLSRPLKWMDNVWGRALSRYSVYAQNFGVQVTGNRIYRPIKQWSDAHPMTDDSVPLFKLAFSAAIGRDDVFKKAFGDTWETAYNDFPMEAVHNFYKVFGALGVGNAMMITRGGVLDLTSIATNEALGNDDYEAWSNVDKYLALGQRADTGENFYLTDIFAGDVQGFDLMKAFTNQLAMTSRIGFGGRYAQIFTEDLRYTQGGIAEMTPVTGLANDMFERTGKVANHILKAEYRDIPKTVSRESMDFLLLRGTPFGTFSDMRDGLLNFVVNKPNNRGVTYVDPSGSELDVTAYEP